jgi:transposase
MPAPYGKDLRKRVVDAYESGAATHGEIAIRFTVGSATVNRWVSRHRRTGSVEPDPMGGRRHCKIDESVDARLVDMVEADVDATRLELVRRLRDELNLEVSPSTVQRALQRLNLTRKKRRSTRRSATPSE